MNAKKKETGGTRADPRSQTSVGMILGIHRKHIWKAESSAIRKLRENPSALELWRQILGEKLDSSGDGAADIRRAVATAKEKFRIYLADIEDAEKEAVQAIRASSGKFRSAIEAGIRWMEAEAAERAAKAEMEPPVAEEEQQKEEP
jgi:hypothetical protein